MPPSVPPSDNSNDEAFILKFEGVSYPVDVAVFAELHDEFLRRFGTFTQARAASDTGAAAHALGLLNETITKLVPELAPKFPFFAIEAVGDELYRAAVERGLIKP